MSRISNQKNLRLAYLRAREHTTFVVGLLMMTEKFTQVRGMDYLDAEVLDFYN